MAKAFDLELYMHPEIEGLLRRREAPPEIMASRLRMARVPQGAELIRNPNGPGGFRVENVCVMAGIPRGDARDVEIAHSDLDRWPPNALAHRDRACHRKSGCKTFARPSRAFSDVDLGSYPFSRDGKNGTSLVARGTDEAVLDKIATSLRQIAIDVGGHIIEAG